jgi:hypothetical protein
LVRQYKYPATDCQPEVAVKVGSSRKRVKVIVFEPGAAHSQEHALVLVETKRAGTSPSNKSEGVDRLRSYIAALLQRQVRHLDQRPTRSSAWPSAASARRGRWLRLAHRGAYPRRHRATQYGGLAPGFNGSAVALYAAAGGLG